MNVFRAIFNGWIRPRMEYQASQIVSAAEMAAGRDGAGSAQAEAEEARQEQSPQDGRA